jgi:hypothetical protein
VVTALAAWGMPAEDIWAPARIRSAAQLEKLVPDRHRDEFRLMWRMESSGVTLAPRTDARAEQLPAASKVFDNPNNS